ncbi:MAG: hypothetical protein V7638_2889, partial [Acidobacteriota bacterium]
MSFKSICKVSLVILLAVQGAQPQTTASAPGSSATPDPLVTLLVSKGVLTTEEASTISSAGTPEVQRDRLAMLLKDKGLISASEFEALRGWGPAAVNVAAGATTLPQPEVRNSANVAQVTQPKQPASHVIPAVAPLRLLPIDVPQREGLIPDIKLGSGARIKPYGYFKTSVIYDSSSPGGNDFPLPLLAADTGPHSSPEFHLKARALR